MPRPSVYRVQQNFVPASQGFFVQLYPQPLVLGVWVFYVSQDGLEVTIPASASTTDMRLHGQ